MTDLFRQVSMQRRVSIVIWIVNVILMLSLMGFAARGMI